MHSRAMSRQFLRVGVRLPLSGPPNSLGSFKLFHSSCRPGSPVVLSHDEIPSCSCGKCGRIKGFNAPWNLTSSSSHFHTASSSQLILFNEYKVPAEVNLPKKVKSVTSSLLGMKRFDYEKESPITQKLVLARSTEEIISVLETDVEDLDTITVSVAVEALFESLKNEQKTLTTKMKHQILTTVGLQKLCKFLRRQSAHMDPGDIINAVKLLSFLCTPGNHLTFQILLKLLSKHANNLDLQQLAYMQFLLDKLAPESKSSLSKALEYALPVVFESKLVSELDRSNPIAICDYLHYTTKYKLSEKSINFLAESASRILDKFSTKAAVSILWSLCDAEFSDPSHEVLVSWCLDKLANSLDDFTTKELATTMSKISKKYHLRKTPYFYNEDFLNAYFAKCTERGIDTGVTLWSLKYAAFFRHVNIEHVDRVGEIIAANPAHILNNDALYFMFVKAISTLNYKPEKWSTFSSLLLEHPALTKNFTVYDVTLMQDFLALDLFPETLIRSLFSDRLHLLEEYYNKFELSYPLVLIYNAVKVLYPQYTGPLPPASMVEQWKEASRAQFSKKTYSLKAALQTGLGGDSYVINGLYHDGIHIDHGILMRKGGYPVAVNSQSDSQSDCLSSISKPAESIMILIKVYLRDVYANNTRRLRGPAALELKILESLGNPVIAIDLASWSELQDHEKIPFLMQRIREKMEHMQWNQNWGDVIPP